MRTLEDVIIRVDQVNDFMNCIEDAMLAAADEGGMNNETKRLHNLVYILMDLIQNIGNDLEEANGHIKVCNAILASAHVREMEAELEELREKIRNQGNEAAESTAGN